MNRFHVSASAFVLFFSALAFAGEDVSGLSDLEKTTFTCPMAGLNAAAREAQKAPTSGTYQFAYFKIISDSAESKYEVGFKSNVWDEPELNYTVKVYCQQGIEPKPVVTRN